MIFLSVPEVAKLLGMKSTSVYEMCRKEKIPALVEYVGGQARYKIPADKLLQFLQDDIARQDYNYQHRISHFRKAEVEIRRRIETL